MFSQYLNKLQLQRIVLLGMGVGVVIYAVFVIVHVSSSYDLGLRTILTPQLVEKPLSLEIDEKLGGPQPTYLIKRIGDEEVRTWKDVLQAPRELHDKILAGQPHRWHRQTETGQDFVIVEYVRSDDPLTTRTFECELRRVPLVEMIPSLIWLFLKGALFVIGALVYWKRPNALA